MGRGGGDPIFTSKEKVRARQGRRGRGREGEDNRFGKSFYFA